MLGDLRERADTRHRHLRASTSTTSRARSRAVSRRGERTLRVASSRSASSTGIPLDADHVVDVRFLSNPYWVAELRHLTGRDARVRDYVLGLPGAVDVHRPLRRRARAGARGVPQRGEAVRDDRRRLHGRQAPLGRRSARRSPRGCGSEGTSWPCRAPRPRQGMRAAVRRRSSRSAAATACRPRCPRCASMTDRITAVVTVADDGARPAGCATSSASCRRATCGWRCRPCATTPTGAGRGVTCCSTGSARRGDLDSTRWATCSSSRCGSCWGTRSQGSTGWASCWAPAAGCCRWRRCRCASRPTSSTARAPARRRHRAEARSR